MSTRAALGKWMTLALVPPVLLGLAAMPALAQEKLRIDGATGVLPLARALTSAYREEFPEAQVEVGAGLSTGERLQALAEGRIQLSVASHGITPRDIQAGTLTVIRIARGAVVFAVNETVPITSIAEPQICDIYSGSLGTWRSIGGADSPIAVLTRPVAEVDQEVIRAKIACFTDLKETAAAKVMPRGGDMARALAETPQAIGMTSMTVVAQSGGKVKALALNGVAPTAENVRSGLYTLTRDFLFVVKGEPAGAARKFLDFVLGPKGVRVILANGAVP